MSEVEGEGFPVWYVGGGVELSGFCVINLLFIQRPVPTVLTRAAFGV